MKKCVYPLVVYADHDEDCYVGLFPDLDITSSGLTVEETFLRAVDSLKVYLNFAIKMDYDISAPCTYEETVGLNPKRVILLTYVEVADDAVVLTPKEQSYKNVLSALLVNKEN